MTTLSAEEARQLLSPPAFAPLEHQIQKAHMTYAFEEFALGCMMDLSSDQVHWRRQGKDNLDRFCSAWDGNWWEAWISREDFEKKVLTGLADMHNGDCISMPSTCTRCFAEELFGLENTARWTRAQGHALAMALGEKDAN